MDTTTITIPVHICEQCGNAYVRRAWWSVHDLGQGTDSGVPAQLERAGLRRGARHWSDDLCAECEQAGLQRFTCAGCHQERDSTEVQRSFGDPPERLCATCYATMTARDWDTLVDRLEEEHRWDFE